MAQFSDAKNQAKRLLDVYNRRYWNGELPDCRIRFLRLRATCGVAVTNEHFAAGRNNAQQSESLAKRPATERQHKQAIQNWNSSDLPGWLTRDVFAQIQPALAGVAKSLIRSVLGVSEPYSSDIRAGRRIPHSRHWQALAKLVGIYS